MPEFIAVPYDIQLSPALARDPKVYKFDYSKNDDKKMKKELEIGGQQFFMELVKALE